LYGQIPVFWKAEWMFSSVKASRKAPPPDFKKVFLVNAVIMEFLMLIDHFFPAFLHLCKTYNIQALKGMSAMRWVFIHLYVVCKTILKQIGSEMEAMAIHEKDTGFSSSFLLGLLIKVFCHPIKGKATISPPIFCGREA
jgi:hypothetical protein